MVKRTLDNIICSHLIYKKIILLFGARQVGKTTLLESLSCLPDSETLILNGDETNVKDMLTNPSSFRLKHAFAGYKFIIIDEAQGIPEIGRVLKIIYDKIKDVQVIASGSSSFELANRANEPLTGRKLEFMLFPFTFQEMVAHHSFLKEVDLLDIRLIYGYYPEVVNNPATETKILKLIAGSYLYKDILRLENIHRSTLLEKILKALALQIGSEVSYNEIAKLCGTNPKTVEKYIDILEKAYIIFKLPALSRNIRNEIKKGKKIYFWDNGIRNAVIDSLSEVVSLRIDTGMLWENFIISERMKLHYYNQTGVKCYFWRTHLQQEIDFVEEYSEGYSIYEFKWNKNAKVRFSKAFLNTYKVLNSDVITPGNLEVFLLESPFN
ncbi:MAG: ATP-binding protein [Bacteroidales bacterium]|nr:ATP-binding protein [Bacteroidales bacterium]MCF8336750.1 ATP-binding protein [Bacteroidales bacterium]